MSKLLLLIILRLIRAFQCNIKYTYFIEHKSCLCYIAEAPRINGTIVFHLTIIQSANYTEIVAILLTSKVFIAIIDQIVLIASIRLHKLGDSLQGLLNTQLLETLAL